MNPIIIVILVLCVGVGSLIAYLIKSFLMPKKLASVIKLIKSGRYSTAAKACKVIIAKEPRNALAHFYLGQIYLAEGKGEIALMEYKIVNQLSYFGPDLNEIEFRKKIAELYSRFNQHEEALKEYLLLIKLEPNSANNYYWAGKLFDARNRTDMALQYLRKTVELDPRHGNAHFLLGQMLYKEKKPVEAKAEIDAAIRYEPNNAEAFFYLGKMQKESKDYTGALLAFEKAQRDPNLKIKALVERGGCYMSGQAYDKAIPELERAIKASKDEASNETLYARYFLATCHEKMRNLDLAIEQWEKIYQKKTTFKDVAEKLSQYQEFRTDDRIKDYITCSKEDFQAICESITTSVLSLNIRDIQELPNGIDIIAVENDSGKWLGTRKMPKLIRFVRFSEIIEDSFLRKILEDIKKVNVINAKIITSSGFTRTAVEFAENRQLQLCGKEQLQEYLSQAEFYKKKK